MIKNKTIFGYIMLAGILGCLATSAFAAPLQILEFKKAQFSQTEQDQLCKQAKDLCQQDVQWRSLKTPDQNLWILSSRNDIAQFKPTALGFKLVRKWNIVTVATEDGHHNQYIFPKLFPLTQQRYAIAIIDQFSEMYSGGGANIERASFYELKDSGDEHRFIENYPFSFSRMIRACFSEQDYESSKGKCHDEDGLSLDIRPLKPMLWQFRYHYRLDVSPASDSNEKSYQGSRNLNIDLNKVPKQPNIPVNWDYTGQE
ncbi:hypothetical protein QTA56_16350 [Acinetobacter sp. VNH17]|uniref:Uncharacterized protein n=2 Tax=Acinetobacter thutiue TaxID=2998078 RepID=A0ABT7WSX6_9GAMM|nr:hypothetical protein [Acinetobacter thutiue]MCY6413684.1 hypothetical protein [Acinetobacter thutiue]MDN0015793.1 hypothetical protein [Acinetobacter thutiue]